MAHDEHGTHLTASFHPDDSMTVAAPNGGLAHRDSVAHGERFERTMWPVTDGVWCMVGNGLSNQTFVEGPDGLIVIDTGESTEEMHYALQAVRQHTDAPLAAVVYTHFHYVGGTAALFDGEPTVPIWGHAGIVANRQRSGGEVGPVARSGLIHQFGMTLPDEGPDALVNVGLGQKFRRADHAPFTEGFIEPTQTFTESTSTTLAGLAVEFTPAPSDADDSITIWFPELSVCINNIVWPVLFNVFAIRGEEYRDPRVLLSGFDHIIGLRAQHLVCAHGPPLSGADRVADETMRSRDAVQFLWDQTVRGINKGMTTGELIQAVQLPDLFAESHLQTQFYGLVEHHVRQIHAGLRGWFDGDEATLFPTPPTERAEKLVAGFGGADAVRAEITGAVAADDLRWALEMSTWLVRLHDVHDDDRRRSADVLRLVGQRTTAANVRNWCLTRARHLDGSARTDRFHAHRFDRQQALTAPLANSLHTLRVLLDPARCAGANVHLCVDVGDDRAGLHVRNGVAVPTDGKDASLTVHLDRDTWASLLTRKLTLAEGLDQQIITCATGSTQADIQAFLAWFEHTPFQPC